MATLGNPALSLEERATAERMANEILAALETAADRRYLSTRALQQRAQVLDLQLARMPSGERARIICERLGISKSRF